MAYWIPAYLKAIVPYLSNPNAYNYGMWNAPDPGDIHGPFGPGVPGEGGVDLGAAKGTPVYALGDGDVVGSGYWRDSGHGVVTIRTNVPGHGLNDIYYQHITIGSGIHQGMHILRGQQIGVIDGFNEIEIGANANWGQPWGLNHPAGWVKDPRPLIKALMALGQPTGVPTSIQPTGTGSSSSGGSSTGSSGNTGSGNQPTIDPGGILSETGQWIAINLFKEDQTLVHLTNSFVPYQILGAVAFAFIAALIAFIFITLIGL